MFEVLSRNKQKQNIFSALKQPSGFYNTLRHGAWLLPPLPALPHLIVCWSFILLGSLMPCNPWQTRSGNYVLAEKISELMSTVLLWRELWERATCFLATSTLKPRCALAKRCECIIMLVCLCLSCSLRNFNGPISNAELLLPSWEVEEVKVASPQQWHLQQYFLGLYKLAFLIQQMESLWLAWKQHFSQTHWAALLQLFQTEMDLSWTVYSTFPWVCTHSAGLQCIYVPEWGEISNIM